MGYGGAAPGMAVGLLLTPGAGADRNQAALVAIDERLSSEGVVVERMDFPYRLAGRKSPDRPPVLLAAIREGAAALAERAGLLPEQVALGGRSMGGRMCSIAVAEGLPALALVLISYPLHPPGKPEQLRTDHFAKLDLPCLFVSGTRDAFGSPDELTRGTKSIPGSVTHHFIDGGDHGLRRRDADVAMVASEFFNDLMR
jgi:predicted alpha/beta-hydrolase family hydrolase